MLKLIKYEIRKNIISMLIVLGAVVSLQIYFLISAAAESRTHSGIAAGLLVIAAFVVYVYVPALGVSRYSKELSSKTSYLTFMTPVSSHEIIWSKLLSTLLTGIFFAVIFVVFAFADMALFEKIFPEVELLQVFIEQMTDAAGVELAEVGMAIMGVILEILVSFFNIVSMTYLAITLSATAFQNKKGKSVISVLIFVGLVMLVTKIADLIPEVYSNPETITQGIISELPLLAYMTVITIFSLFVSAKLLDKKVSL